MGYWKWDTGNGMFLVQTSSPVEKVVCNLGVDDHTPLTGQDLIEGRDAVGNHLSILVLQHLVQYVHQVELYVCACVCVCVCVCVRVRAHVRKHV